MLAKVANQQSNQIFVLGIVKNLSRPKDEDLCSLFGLGKCVRLFSQEERVIN